MRNIMGNLLLSALLLGAIAIFAEEKKESFEKQITILINSCGMAANE